MADPIVIVGGGGAGATAAATLRQEGFDGPVLLVGAEDAPPYDRPPVSKDYLTGEASFESMLLYPEDFWEEQGIEVRFGTAVTSLDPDRRTVALADGDRRSYDKVLLATGGRNRRPPIPGIDLDGVLDVRTVADADAVRRRARAGTTAVVVGMGFIGCEVAAALVALGVEVVAVEALPAPLARVFGTEIGQVVADLHRGHGVEVLLDEAVDRFEGDGRLEAVVTRSGRRLGCDLAVIGLGIAPRTDLAEAAGIAVDNGILVDERCRSSVVDVYAAGDVANHYHPLLGRRIRVEHWTNAVRQGAAAARSMLGAAGDHRDVPWFWSDQYDTTIQYAGAHGQSDQVVMRGDPATRRFAAFWLTGRQLEGAVAFNRPRDVRAAMRLMAAGADVDPTRLADEDTDLRTLVPA